MSDSETVPISNPNHEDLPKNAKYKFIQGDVRNLDLNPILKDSNVLIHLAAITDAAGSFENAQLVEENNYNSTLKVLEACKVNNIKIIMLSTTSVYGTIGLGRRLMQTSKSELFLDLKVHWEFLA